MVVERSLAMMRAGGRFALPLVVLLLLLVALSTAAELEVVMDEVLVLGVCLD